MITGFPDLFGIPHSHRLHNLTINMTGNDSTFVRSSEAPYLYLEHHLGWMIVTAMIIGGAAVIGTLGNLLIVVTVCLIKTLRTTGNVFVVNLALADLVVTAFVDPFNVVGAVAGRSVLLHDETLCDWIGSICAPACMSSMWNILSRCAISLNRYILICKPHLYHDIFTFRTSILISIGIWVGSHVTHLPLHFGWGKNRFNHQYYVCTFDIVTHSFAIYHIVMGVLVPLVGVLYGYTGIFLKVRSVKRQLRQHQHIAVVAAQTVQTNSDFLQPLATDKSGSVSVAHQKMHRPKRPGFTQDDVKLAKTLFAAFLVFLICWTPLSFFVLAHQPSFIPGWLYTLAIIMAHGNSAVNPILYGLTNEKFRDGYRTVLGLNKKHVAPSDARPTAIVSGNFTAMGSRLATPSQVTTGSQEDSKVPSYRMRLGSAFQQQFVIQESVDKSLSVPN